MGENVSKGPNYWRYAATVDHCNVVIRELQRQIAEKRKRMRQWEKYRDEAIRLAEEHSQ